MALHAGSRRTLLQARMGAWLKRPLADKLRALSSRGQRALDRTEDALFDMWHGLDCGGYVDNRELTSEFAAALPYARAYEPITCALLRRLLAEARKTGIRFDNFVDLGSGKGKACFYAAASGRFGRVVGVEFSHALVAAAEANRKRFGHDISFINADAATCTLPEGVNLVFLFNPFGEHILRNFIENNIEHFRTSRSIIAYANDQHRLCLASLGFATLFRDQDCQSSLLEYRRP